jgi:hypothetical protein
MNAPVTLDAPISATATLAEIARSLLARHLPKIETRAQSHIPSECGTATA